MDTAAATVQFVTFTASLAKALIKAYDAAKSLQQLNEDTRDICQSLNASIIIINDLCLLEHPKPLSPAQEKRLQPHRDNLQNHKRVVDELASCLLQRRIRVSRWYGRVQDAFRGVLRETEPTELDRCWKRFLESQKCIHWYYNELHLLKADSAAKELDGFAQATGSQLQQISSSQQSDKEILYSIHTNVEGLIHSSHAHNGAGTRTAPGPLRRPKTVFKVPFERNRFFTGREDLLAQIASCLLPAREGAARPADDDDGGADNDNDNGRIFVLSGLPGIGKTHTAIEFCYQHRQQFRYIFWVAADSPEKLEDGYVAIAKALRLTSAVAVQDKDNVIQMAREWLQGSGGSGGGGGGGGGPRHGPASWLLVLDNVDDFSILQSSWSDFRRGAVLLTSREKMPNLAAISRHSQSAQMTAMTAGEGGALLQKLLAGVRWPGRPTQGGQPLPLDAEQAAKWAEQIHFPLYMEQVAVSVSEGLLSPDEQLPDRDRQALALRARSLWYTDQSLEEAMADHMAKLDDDSRQVLVTWAFFDPDKIPDKLLVSSDGRVSALRTPAKSKNTLLTLSHRSFVSRGQEDPDDEEGEDADADADAVAVANAHRPLKTYVRMHRVVRDVALQQAPRGRVRAAFADATSLLRQAFPLHGVARDHMVEQWDACEEFQPHVLALHKRYLELQRERRLAWTPASAAALMDFADLIYSCAWYLCERGRFAIGKTLITTADGVHQSLQTLSVPRGLTGGGGGGGGNGVASSGALALFLADLYTVQLYVHNEAGEDVAVASTAGLSLVELATKALHLREHAVAAGVLDPDHPNLANGYMNVGVVLAGDDPWKAIEMHQKALHIRQRTDKYKAEQHHGLALNFLNIGRCWWMVKESEKAAACFSDCITLMYERELVMRKRYPLTSWAMAALALVRIDEDRLQEAKQLLLDSEVLHQETMGEKHMKTLSCSYRLAWIWHRLREFRKARKILQFCLDAYCTMPSAPKAEIARTKFKLAQVEEDSGQEGSRHVELRREAQNLLVEVSGAKVAGREASEADFDAAIAYFIR